MALRITEDSALGGKVRNRPITEASDRTGFPAAIRGSPGEGLQRVLTSPEARRVLGLPTARARWPIRCNPISCQRVLAREGLDAFPSSETPPVHHAARRR